MGIEAVEPPGILAPAVAAAVTVVDRAEHAHRRTGLVAEGACCALDILQPAAEVLGVTQVAGGGDVLGQTLVGQAAVFQVAADLIAALGQLDLGLGRA